ncbi:MAG: RnfH family protein [Halothiobacillus sp. 24-54-40]|nr:RnfH family protein [Halothiobacillaceae bacterium]OYV47334.1 MAG: RnfH family protein [Halothiobacillus sp. 20-53-49]OYY40561.1 MAG: RnfH family protein [Halothiobacillus sp. 35-54-62]OYY54093.1 MAG: RnfH family protein [Halothiobacillus sp. 28-55-5]OYZ88000.1 MAG: RnfH family protein [Halothiobacillus sp. 24-54-40]OZA80371.1 MAG: RnfH family protein [Halothiobacillus sp. 39-53-45]
MRVEVAYALPDQQVILPVLVAIDATADMAIKASGVLEQFADIDLTRQKIGIFSRLVPLTQPLQPRDRIEIYRPLQADPKTARRARALKTAD